MSIEVCSSTRSNISNRSIIKMFTWLCVDYRRHLLSLAAAVRPHFFEYKNLYCLYNQRTRLSSHLFHLHFAFAFARSSAHLLRQQAARVPEAFDRYAKLLALPDLPTAYTGAALLALGRLHAALASEQSRALCHTLALAAAERSLASFATCATPLPS